MQRSALCAAVCAFVAFAGVNVDVTGHDEYVTRLQFAFVAWGEEFLFIAILQVIPLDAGAANWKIWIYTTCDDGRRCKYSTVSEVGRMDIAIDRDGSFYRFSFCSFSTVVACAAVG